MQKKMQDIANMWTLSQIMYMSDCLINEIGVFDWMVDKPVAILQCYNVYFSVFQFECYEKANRRESQSKRSWCKWANKVENVKSTLASNKETINSNQQQRNNYDCVFFTNFNLCSSEKKEKKAIFGSMNKTTNKICKQKTQGWKIQQQQWKRVNVSPKRKFCQTKLIHNILIFRENSFSKVCDFIHWCT